MRPGTYINDIDAAGPQFGPAEPDPAIPAPGAVGSLLPYYQKAYAVYYGPLPGGIKSLNERRMAAALAVMDYLEEHGGPAGDAAPAAPGGDDGDDGDGGEAGEPDAGEPDPLPPGPEEPEPEGQNGDPAGNGSPAGAFDEGTGEDNFDYEYYNSLVAAEYAAIEDCNTSLMAAYDAYDTLAVDALVAKEAVKVIFRIRGEQLEPGENIS